MNMLDKSVTRERAHWTEGISYQVQFLADFLPEAQRWVLGVNCHGRRWSQEFSGGQRYVEADAWMKKNVSQGAAIGVFLGDMRRSLGGGWPRMTDYAAVPVIAVGSFDPRVWKRFAAEDAAPCAVWLAPNELWVIAWKLPRPISYLEAMRMADARAEMFDARRVDIPLLPDRPEAVHLLRMDDRLAPSAGAAQNTRRPAWPQGHAFDAPPAPPRTSARPATSQPTAEQAERAKQLVEVLRKNGVNARVVRVRPGPVVTSFGCEIAEGVKSSKVIDLADEVAFRLHADSAIARRGAGLVHFDLTNERREFVSLEELFATPEWERAKREMSLPLALGVEVDGTPLFADLARMPHFLVAGMTGGGKSVALSDIILSLISCHSPDALHMILIDPKRTELVAFADIPHLKAPIIKKLSGARKALGWVVKEMERRYDILESARCRDVGRYNAKVAAERARNPHSTLTPLPRLVVVIDEFGKLKRSAAHIKPKPKGPDFIDLAVSSLSAEARAAGVHLVLCTQSPNAETITGPILDNIPSRLALKTRRHQGSQAIIGETGAEKLLGKGDALWSADDALTRVHCAYASDDYVERIADQMREFGEPDYVPGIADDGADDVVAIADDGEDDDFTSSVSPREYSEADESGEDGPVFDETEMGTATEPQRQQKAPRHVVSFLAAFMADHEWHDRVDIVTAAAAVGVKSIGHLHDAAEELGAEMARNGKPGRAMKWRLP